MTSAYIQKFSRTVCTPETHQQRGKINIAFRDTAPALSVYLKISCNEKVESYTSLLRPIFKNHLSFPTRKENTERTCLLELKYKRVTQGFMPVWMCSLSPLAFFYVNFIYGHFVVHLMGILQTFCSAGFFLFLRAFCRDFVCLLFVLICFCAFFY